MEKMKFGVHRNLQLRFRLYTVLVLMGVCLAFSACESPVYAQFKSGDGSGSGLHQSEQEGVQRGMKERAKQNVQEEKIQGVIKVQDNQADAPPSSCVPPPKNYQSPGGPTTNVTLKAGAKDVKKVPSLHSEHIPKLGEKVQRSEQEWKQVLTPQQYRVLREKGTERRFSGPLNRIKQKDGVFHCAACGAPLFKAKDKYDSGSGWPSFHDRIEGRVETHEDRSLGMVRTEVTCAACGSHLGHVFNDGPGPKGLRYCINSAAMNFSKTPLGETKSDDSKSDGAK